MLDERQFGSATEHMYRSSLFDNMPCSLSLHIHLYYTHIYFDKIIKRTNVTAEFCYSLPLGFFSKI